VETEHFTVSLLEPDRAAALAVATHFEVIHTQVCADLGCPADGSDRIPLSFVTTFYPPNFDFATSTIILPTPGLQGVYYEDLAATRLIPNSEFNNIAYTWLPFYIARQVAGGWERWNVDRQGDLLVGNIANWESQRLLSQSPSFDQLNAQLAQREALLPLADIWEAVQPDSDADLDLLVIQTWSLIGFVEARYGTEGIRQLLIACGPATSLAEAVETGLGVPLAELEAEWQQWVLE
jgi:hypothetical protein